MVRPFLLVFPSVEAMLKPLQNRGKDWGHVLEVNVMETSAVQTEFADFCFTTTKQKAAQLAFARWLSSGLHGEPQMNHVQGCAE